MFLTILLLLQGSLNTSFKSNKTIENPKKTEWKFVKPFVNIFKEKTSSYKLEKNELSIQKYLGDPVFFTSTDLMNKYSNKKGNHIFLGYVFSLYSLLKKKFGSFFSIDVWNPYDFRKLLWNKIFFAFLIVLFFEIPLNISFHTTNQFSFVVIAMVFCDMLINLNSAFYTSGNLVVDRKIIVQHYFSRFFAIDLLTLVITLLTLIFESSSEMDFLQFSKLLLYGNSKKLIKIHKTLDEKYKLYYRLAGVLEIIEQICYSVFIIHLFACGFYWVSSLRKNFEDDSWISEMGLTKESWLKNYLFAFYWSTITIMTVGYGDVTPKNDWERVFTILTAIGGCGFFAFNVSTIGRIFEKMNRDNEQFRENNNIITKYMEKKKINENMQLKIKAYLRHFWKEEKIQDDEKQAQVIGHLTKSLQLELLYEANSKILYGFPLFYSNFSERTIKKSVHCLKELRFSPGDMIYDVFILII